MGNITSTELILKENLHKLRSQKNLSAYAVAKSIGMDSGQYYRLENKQYHNKLTYDYLERIAKFYQIEFYELFKKIE